MKASFKIHRKRAIQAVGKDSSGLTLRELPQSRRTFQEFAMWLHDNTKDGSFRDIYECGEKISRLLGGSKVFERMTYQYITFARKYLETHHKCSVMNVRGWGYRIAVKEDIAWLGGKRAKKWFALGIDTMRILRCVESQYTPITLKSIYAEVKKDKRFATKEAQEHLRMVTRGIRGYNNEKREELGELLALEAPPKKG